MARVDVVPWSIARMCLAMRKDWTAGKLAASRRSKVSGLRRLQRAAERRRRRAHTRYRRVELLGGDVVAGGDHPLDLGADRRQLGGEIVEIGGDRTAG